MMLTSQFTLVGGKHRKCAHYSFYQACVINHPVMLQNEEQQRNLPLYLPYMAVLKFESGTALLLLRKMHLPSQTKLLEQYSTLLENRGLPVSTRFAVFNMPNSPKTP